MASTPYSLIRTSHVFHPVVTWICLTLQWPFCWQVLWRHFDIQLLSSLSLHVKTTNRHLGKLPFGWGTALFRWTKNWRQSFKWDLQLVWSAVAVLPGNMAVLSRLSEMFKKKICIKTSWDRFLRFVILSVNQSWEVVSPLSDPSCFIWSYLLVMLRYQGKKSKHTCQIKKGPFRTLNRLRYSESSPFICPLMQT